MDIKSIISVLDSNPSAELAGAADGSSWQHRIRGEIDAAPSGLCAVDFRGVRIATVSWLREGLIGLRKYTEAMRPDVLLMAANASALVQEELAATMDATGSVMIATDLGADLRIMSPTLLGRLDPALHQTLLVIRGCQELDATYVTKRLPLLGLSAANNRLAALESKGILHSERRGRTRVFRPTVEELIYGN